MGYVHVDILTSQSAKRPGAPCGDVVAYDRTPRGTTLVCCDGMGSGIRANIAATMTVSRLHELLRRDFSLREAVARVSRTLVEARERDLPYACFAVARINTDGEGTVLSYEMPPAVFISARRFATGLPRRPLVLDGAMVHETSCCLAPGEALLLVSDGITQAGLGTTHHDGWTIDGVCAYVNARLTAGLPLEALPASVQTEARNLSLDLGRIPQGDDCTVALARCRAGNLLVVLTGPPPDREQDDVVMQRFLRMPGRKVVCGGTTARILARHTRQRIDVRQDTDSLIAPPDYILSGVDLATEGAVTLNQAFNILDEDPQRYERATGVSRLCELLREADRITFLVGRTNDDHGDIRFRQRGILPRETIVPLLADKLRASGKLVTLEYL